MLCPKCGSEIRDGLSFCPKCGAEFGKLKTPSQEQTIEVEVSDSQRSGVGVNGKNAYRNNVPHAQYEKLKIYQRTWFIILALIFFWPLGVFLMWRFSRWNRIVKIIISILCFLSIIGLFADNGEEKDVAVDSNETQIETEAVVENAEAKDETKTTAAKEKNSIKMVEGFDKLQSLYLQIDDTFAENIV